MIPSGESIRVVHPLFQVEGGGSIPTSPLQLTVGQCHVRTAIDLNRLWHSRFPNIEESNVVRNRRSICFAAEFGGLFYACAIWSDPVAANRLKDGDRLIELRRMAIADDAPSNTASRMLKLMRMEIRRKWPELVGLISYQDADAHHGTIYKASGWRCETEQKFTPWETGSRKRAKPQSTAAKIRWRFDLG
jgi:hypothetical protein